MVMTGTGCYVIWQPDYHQCIDLVYLVFDGRPLWINVKSGLYEDSRRVTRSSLGTL